MTKLTNTGPLTADRIDPDAARAADLAELERIADWLDTRYRLFGIRFGWDSLLGLIPGIGDVATLLPSAYLVWQGHKKGVRRRTLARMSLNTGMDFLIGGIPVIGDIFDLFFKANRRNIALMKRDLARRTTAT